MASQTRESEFTTQVRAQARLLGWMTYHTLRSDGSEAGFPDLILVWPTAEAKELAKPGAFEKHLADALADPAYASGLPLIVAELKREQEYPKPEQRLWLAVFAQITPHVAVWRPSDWDEIVRVLKEARPAPYRNR